MKSLKPMVIFLLLLTLVGLYSVGDRIYATTASTSTSIATTASTPDFLVVGEEKVLTVPPWRAPTTNPTVTPTSMVRRSFEFPPPLPIQNEIFMYYTPTGGWGNQRLMLMDAMVISALLGRSLILPAFAPHLKGYYLAKGYTKLGKLGLLVSMDQLIDMERLENGLNKLVRMASANFDKRLKVYVHGSTMESLKEKALPLGLKWYEYDNLRSSKRGGIKSKWTQESIINTFKGGAQNVFYSPPVAKVEPLLAAASDVLYWGGGNGMFGCCRFSDALRLEAAKAIGLSSRLKLSISKPLERLIPSTKYLAVHVRRGDKLVPPHKGTLVIPAWERNICSDSNGKSLMARLREVRTKASLDVDFLYIASDEQNSSVFECLKQDYKNLVLGKDLKDDPGIQAELRRFPQPLQEDLLSFFELLVCENATEFLGTSVSTFSTSIHCMRGLSPWISEKPSEDFLVRACTDKYLRPEDTKRSLW